MYSEKNSQEHWDKYAPEIWDDLNPYAQLWRRITKHVKRFLTGAVVLIGIIVVGLVAITLWIEFWKLQISQYIVSGAIVLVILFMAYKIGECIAE